MLLNIIKTVDNHPHLSPKKLNHCRSKLSTPLGHYDYSLPKYEDLKKAKVFKPGQSYTVLIKVKYLWADTIYNRIAEINLTQALKNLESRGGFSYPDANTLVAFLRPNGQLVLTQGNHRVTKCYLTQGPDAYVVVNVNVHSSLDPEQWIKTEAQNFTTDNNLRWNMIQGHKFKGGYAAKDKYYVDLYEFAKQFNVSIAGTNEGDFVATHTFESYGNLEEALKLDDTPNKEYVKFAMHSLTNHLIEQDIKGFLFVGLVQFQKVFGERLNKIQKQNRLIYSFDDFIKFIFTERRTFNGMGKLTTQQDIVEDSGGIKIREFFASRFVVLFNEYCFARQIDFNRGGLKGSCAIPETCEEWKNLIENLSSVKRRLLSVDRL